ncbi:MAG: DUF3592 domain-containing protein [Massilia sp.]
MTLVYVFAWLLGLVFLIVGVAGFREGMQNRRWHKVTGFVRRIAIERSMEGERTVRYAVRVDYRYTVGGHARNGRDQVGSTEYSSEVDALVAPYVVGGPLDVYVNPDNATRSSLRIGVQFGDLLPIIFGAGMMAFFSYQLSLS